MRKWVVFIVEFIFVCFIGINIAGAFEVTVYGRGIPTEHLSQEKGGFKIDLGMHAIPSEVWEQSLDLSDHMAILPRILKQSNQTNSITLQW
mgnify:CR=1 FL=1